MNEAPVSASCVPVSMNARWLRPALFPSARHSLWRRPLSGHRSEPQGCHHHFVLRRHWVVSALLYCSRFSQACGCLSPPADMSPVIWFCSLPPCSATVSLLSARTSIKAPFFSFFFHPVTPHFAVVFEHVLSKSDR